MWHTAKSHTHFMLIQTISLYGVHWPREWLWIDINGKMETSNPVEDYFDSEFQAIYNRCGVMAAWSRMSLKFFAKFLRFLKKRSLTVKFSKLCSESFHRDTGPCVVCKVREIWPTESRWNRALLTWQKKKTKFRLAVSLSRLRRSLPQSTTAILRQCPQSAPDFIQIGLLSAELYPNAWIPSKRALKCFQYSAKA